MKNFRLLTAALLIFNIVLLSAGFKCGGATSKDAINEAAKASYRLPVLTGNAADAVLRGFNEGKISLELKDKIADPLSKMAKATPAIIETVAALEKLQTELDALNAKTGKTDDDKTRVAALRTDIGGKFSALKILFNQKIVASFLDVLSAFKLLSPDAAATVAVAVEALRLVLVTIGRNFDIPKAANLSAVKI
jgi:hypothetical protein